MDSVEKCLAIGLEVIGMRDGLPVFHGRFLRRDLEGQLRIYVDRDYRPFEEPEEDTGFPQEVLRKIQAIVDGSTTDLSPEETAELALQEAKELFTSSLDTLPDAMWKEFLFEVMKERLKSKPAYLASWIAKVEAAGLSEALK